MEQTFYVFEIVIKRKMGIGTADVGVREVQTFYFIDGGDISFSQRLVNYFEHGFGAHHTDFEIVSVKNIGEALKTDRK